MIDPRALAVSALLALAACATPPSTTSSGGVTEAPASRLAAPPAAVHVPDAPGLNVEDLSARLRDAFQIASGVETVDELSVRAELAACTEAPCPEVVADRFRNASFIVASSVSRVGSVFLATVRVQRGAQELARAGAQDKNAAAALEAAAREAGHVLHDKLVAEGASEVAAAPRAPNAVDDNQRTDEGEQR